MKNEDKILFSRIWFVESKHCIVLSFHSDRSKHFVKAPVKWPDKLINEIIIITQRKRKCVVIVCERVSGRARGQMLAYENVNSIAWKWFIFVYKNIYQKCACACVYGFTCLTTIDVDRSSVRLAVTKIYKHIGLLRNGIPIWIVTFFFSLSFRWSFVDRKRRQSNFDRKNSLRQMENNSKTN